MSASLKKENQKNESRVERKRRDSRERILKAAKSLMSEREVDSVTIQDITEAADIGHGTFYLHFKSKFEVLVPILHERTNQLDERLKLALAKIDDPAEIMAHSSRHMARMISEDRLWSWSITHSGIPKEEVRDALGRYSGRDFKMGLASGRFKVPNSRVAADYTLGGFVNSILSAIDNPNGEAIIDFSTELMLRVFGIPPDEAHSLAHKALIPLND